VFYGLGNLARQNETVSRLPTEIYERYDLGPEALPSDLYDTRVFEDDGTLRGVLQRPRYWETIVPRCTYEDGELVAVELYPVDLGMDEPRPRRGRPTLASGDRAAEIIDRLADLSAQFGTEIWMDGNVGVVEL
jgi:poly-gamma-glutamate synthesis protein (capsule biosynthesis protein)